MNRLHLQSDARYRLCYRSRSMQGNRAFYNGLIPSFDRRVRVFMVNGFGVWRWDIINITITKTCFFKYTENFTIKNENFQIKNSDIFHVSAQNIECEYPFVKCLDEAVLTSTHNLCFEQNKQNNVYPCKPQFYYIMEKMTTKGHFSI